ncbi:MAG: hypothetical protein ABWY93_02880 [Mycobacterium sp.]
MAESSYPTAGGGGVTDAIYERLMGGQTGDGMVGSPTQPSMVYADSSGRNVKVRANRAAIVRGFYYTSGPNILTLPITSNASGKTRLDRVNLRLDRTTYQIRAHVTTGTPSTSPKAPSLLQQNSPDRYWELPLAIVRVNAGATGLQASAVTNISYFLAEPAITGPSASKPAVASSGQIFRDIDIDRVWIGTEAGAWRSMYYDTGWRNCTPATGWKTGSGFRVRRKHGWVSLTMSIIRSGGTLKKNDPASRLYTLPVGFRPSMTLFGTVAASGPDHIAHIKVNSTGAVTLEPNFTNGIDKDSYLIGTITYPING